MIQPDMVAMRMARPDGERDVAERHRACVHSQTREAAGRRRCSTLFMIETVEVHQRDQPRLQRWNVAV